MLITEIIPSTLILDKATYLSQDKPFYMQFLADVKCSKCENKVGVRMLTVSSEFHYP